MTLFKHHSDQFAHILWQFVVAGEGYIQKSVRLKRKDIAAFMETISEYNSKVVYRNSMHRELLIRERNNGWLRRRLAEHGINVPQNTVARWISNFFMPTPQTKAKVEEILEFEWV